jgi:hypothetical protein
MSGWTAVPGLIENGEVPSGTTIAALLYLLSKDHQTAPDS